MAGTLGTPTITNLGGTRELYSVAWTATTGGDVSDEALTLQFPGRLYHVRIIPSTGATQPTDAFDVTLLTTDGEDLLAGQGANSTNDGVTRCVATVPLALEGVTVYPTIANAGDSKTGVVKIVIGE